MVFLFIMFCFVVLLIVLVNSKIRIKIKQIDYESQETKIQLRNDSKKQLNIIRNSENALINENKLNNKIDIRIQLIILGFIPIFWQKIDNQKIAEEKQKNKYKNRFNKILSKIKSDNKINSVEIIKTIKENINMEIKKFNLFFIYGTDNVILNSIVAPVIATILTILFCKKQVKEKQQKYKLIPIYNSRKFNKNNFFGYI